MTANPAVYVPRDATEHALAALASAVEAGEPVLVLSGPAGLGKTLVLRLLEPRLRGRRTLVYLPYAALPAQDVCAWGLAVLGRPTKGEPGAALAEVARELAARGTPLVLVLDDGSAIPLTTLRRLADLASETSGALSLLIAVTDDEKSDAVLAALSGTARSVRLAEPLTSAESTRYVTERLARAGASGEVRRRFDPVLLDRLHRAARGIPRVLNRLASEVVRRGQEGLLEAELDEPAFEPAPAPKRDTPPPQSPAAARVAVLTAEGAVPGASAGPPAAPPAASPHEAGREAPRAPVATSAAPAKAPRETVGSRSEPVAPAPMAAASPDPPIRTAIERTAAPPPTAEVSAPAPRGHAPVREARATGSAGSPPRRSIGPTQIFLLALAIGAAAIGIPLLLDHPERTKTSGAPAPQASPRLREPAPAGPAPAPATQPRAPAEQESAALPAPSSATPVAPAPPSPRPAPIAPTPSSTPPSPQPAPADETPRPAPVPPAAAPTRAAPTGPRNEVPARAASPAEAPIQPAAAPPAPAQAPPRDERAPQAKPMPVPVSVAVNSTPWATIEIDGREVGDTPLAGIQVPPGPHVFRARFSNGRVVERTVTIDAKNRFVSFR